MQYDTTENSLQAVFQRLIPLSPAQLSRLRTLAIAVMLAGETHLTKIARQIPTPTQQDTRKRWIQRLLDAPFMTQTYVYEPYIQSILHTYNAPQLHLTMDRTDIRHHDLDLLSVNLSFRGRALPIVWELRATGMTSAETQKQLLSRCQRLIPAGRPVIFHGDNEFGSVALMRWLRQQGWDFIVGQAAKNYARSMTQQVPYQLDELPVTPTRAAYRSRVALTKAHWFGPVNVFAFYQPVYHRNRRKQDVRYYSTSLPLAPSIRRVGKRRWGVECFYKDLKSAGWQLPFSQIQAPQRLESLILTLNLVYTWAICVGRWLCKTSRRSIVDNKPKRHLSLFRLGWDWLVHCIRCQGFVPDISILYS